MLVQLFRHVLALRVIAIALIAVAMMKVIGSAQMAQSVQPRELPRTWDAQAIASIEVPLVNSKYSPTHISPDYYYAIPARRVYKSYPVYAPGKEPVNYLEWLRNQEPKIAFDVTQLKSESDWITAGELVFEAPIAYDFIASVSQVRNETWYTKTGTPVSREGIMPFARYVIRKKGEVEVGTLSCAMDLFKI